MNKTVFALLGMIATSSAFTPVLEEENRAPESVPNILTETEDDVLEEDRFDGIPDEEMYDRVMAQHESNIWIN